MPAVFVHGVPETSQLWDKVRAELSDVESIALSLPGFGVPVPDGFGATMDEYAEWLIGELETFDQPVDLVGHDWGGLLTVRLVSIRPELVRSWASDIMGAFHPDFIWHEVAQIWQTPGAGEDMFAGLRALPVEQRAAAFTGVGVPPDDALAMASGIDERMAGCILALYRSAVGVEKQWGPDLGRVERPGLVMFLAGDPLQDKERFQQVAGRAGARLVELEGVGHFWPYEAPERAAALLREFWRGG